MLGRKELTPMEACRNTYYHNRYGLSDKSTWYPHQYYSLGARDTRKKPQPPEDYFWNSSNTYFSNIAEKRRRQEELDRKSQKNYEFQRQVRESLNF